MPFGVKVAPSLFQKAMIKIFEPILHHALVYIDDVLFLKRSLLSDKKSILDQDIVTFLGMTLKDGNYSLGPHIAQELTHFPYEHFSKKQIQQFLGIINYLREFFSHVAVHTSQLSKMLKKSTPLWGPSQTTTVQHLKQITQFPPPLRIPIEGQRILQTYASDEYWGAVLLEKHDGKESYCVHASGQFKDQKNTTM